jgi:hypothetical protein
MMVEAASAVERSSSFSTFRTMDCNEASSIMMCEPKSSEKKKNGCDGRLRRITFRVAVLCIFLLTSLLPEGTAFSTLSFASRGKIIHPLSQKATGNHQRIGRHGVQPILSQWDDSVEVDQSTSSTLSSSRSIARMEKFSRLPVWPVWNGVFIFIVSKLFGEENAAKLEDAIGGRVCPNFFQSEQTSPFIMLVHHRHSFAPWDPLRYIQRTFFPEGFPAHPHRGMFIASIVLV